MDSANQIFFSPSPLCPQPVRVPNMVNGVRLRGMHLDGDPLFANADLRFAVPACEFPRQMPLPSRRPSRPTGNHHSRDRTISHEQDAFVNGQASFFPDTLVPIDASAFYRNSPHPQSWAGVYPSTTPFDPIEQTQGLPPRMVPLDAPSTNPDLLAGFWSQAAVHPLMPFCPFASLIFLNLLIEGDPTAHETALNGLEMMMLLNNSFPEQRSEDSNRGLPPSESHYVPQVNPGSAPSTSSNLQGSGVEIARPTVGIPHEDVSGKPPGKALPHPRKSKAVKGLSPEDNTLLDTSFTDASSNPNPALRKLLDEILGSNFLNDQLPEPLLTQAVGRSMVGKLSGIAGYPQICLKRGAQSLYTLFLEQKGNKCLFCGSYKGVLSRAVGCVRKHLGHRPFVCDGVSCELCEERSDGPARFYTSSLLKDHIKSRTQKIGCIHEDCNGMFRRGNVQRHWEAIHADTPFPYDVYSRYTRIESAMSPISTSSEISFSPYAAELDVAANQMPNIYDILENGGF